jgi:valacyclovir hydrolase
MSWFDHGTSRIYYEVSGNGDPVLLLPGVTESITLHAALRDRLSRRYRVIAADLPGSGRSEPQPRRYAASYYEDDGRAFAALLMAVADKPAHVVGFSDGGEVALLIAALSPPLARSVITWGASGFISDPGGQIRESFHNVIDQPSPQVMDYRSYLIDAYGEGNARAITQGFAAGLTAIIEEAGGDISRSKAGEISCPVLLIAGENDRFAPRALLDELASRIVRAETVEVPGAGHAVHKDRPEWFQDTVLDWLAKH